MDVILGKTQKGNLILIAEAIHGQLALRDGNWKLLMFWER